MTWRVITCAGYLALVGAGVTLELLARRPGSRVPRVGVLLTRAMSTRSGRVSVLAAWTWVGLHFFAR